jgi:hypothetical protein
LDDAVADSSRSVSTIRLRLCFVLRASATRIAIASGLIVS